MKNNPIPALRITGLLEAVSFLVLLGVAMPLKYLAGLPTAVKVAGWIHGVLFVLLCAALLRALVVARWPAGRAALVFVAALLPFGPFLLDRRMKQYNEEFRLRFARA
jgi:integral membrane protein